MLFNSTWPINIILQLFIVDIKKKIKNTQRSAIPVCTTFAYTIRRHKVIHINDS